MVVSKFFKSLALQKTAFILSAAVWISVGMYGVTSAEVVSDLKKINVAIIYDGPSALYKRNKALIQKEILELTQGEFDVVFPPDQIINGEWNYNRIKKATDDALNSESVDFLICMGILSSDVISGYSAVNKPVIATSIIDAELQGLKRSDGSSGVRNLNYLISIESYAENLALFKKLRPYKNIGVIISLQTGKDLPFMKQFFEKYSSDEAGRMIPIYSDDTADSVLGQLTPETDAILVTPDMRLPEEEVSRLFSAVSKKGLPSYTIAGENIVSKGLLAGLTPGAESKTIIRRAALNFQRILLGESPESLPTEFSEKRRLLINMRIAKETGIFPSTTVLAGAEILSGENRKATRRLSLSEVIRETLAMNPDLLAVGEGVTAGAQDIRTARSYLLPTVEASLTGLKIDRNSAEISFGTESEESIKGSLTATQVLFSEKAWSGWQAVKSNQKATEAGFEATKLNITFDACIAYINVLKAETLKRVRTNSLELTKANLNRARLRRSVGTASPSEVYRWESQLANQKRQILDATAKVRQAGNNLSRLLGNSLNDTIQVEEIGVSDPILCMTPAFFGKTAGNPFEYEFLIDFIVQKGLDASPELAQIEAGISARRQLAKSAGRDFFLPTVAVQGTVTDVYDRDGFDMTTDQRDKTAWSVAVNATYPLFTGGAKSAEYIRAKSELKQLKLQKRSVHMKIEERIRSVAESANASFGAIQHARDASAAANKNLDLVTDAYSRGVVSIMELLDAQNASTLAELSAENTVYDFMTDLIGLQRAIGKVDFSDTDQAAHLFEKEFERFKASKINNQKGDS